MLSGLRPACSTSGQGLTCAFSQSILITCFYGNKFVATYSFQPVPDGPHLLESAQLEACYGNQKKPGGVSEKLSFRFPLSEEKKALILEPLDKLG